MTPYLDGAGRNAPARADNRSDSALQARILVVEDDADIASLLGRELRGLGHTVDAVRLAEDALQAARGNDYALMIIDLGLPDGTGSIWCARCVGMPSRCRS